ncbi:hypothetical protein NLU13_2014 [Sarocladium strictum]|uniref:Uncharacterized protein n=1 Tax=Sarocladium strictum TaxID=5046 RepID=A0AA39GST0_SARSR|nr:hypothetical protein NLU13_2014 [Sarocladium strictum]
MSRQGHASNEQILRDLLGHLGLHDPCPIDIQGNDPITPSPHRIGDACAVALAALGAEMARIHKERTGQQDSVAVSVERAIPQLMAVYLSATNNIPAARLLPEPAMFAWSDFYEARNGRYVFLLNTYPHLRGINCRVLNCPFDKERLRQEIVKWDAFALEDAICAQGGTCIAVRSAQEWSSHPQGEILLQSPLIDIEKLDDGEPEPWPTSPTKNEQPGQPLTGIRVLDNTHVIAGPMSARILAEHGAEVLSMASPEHMDPLAMTLETGLGKRSAFCDLDDATHRARFYEALSGADVYITSYLSLDKKGFGPLRLKQYRPGLIFCDFHGWGKSGPWRGRGAFDQLACAATGFAAEEGSPDGPSLPPTHLLNDYLAAILAAAAMSEALRRRARDGGSYRVHISLAKVAMWVQGMGLFSHSEVASLRAPAATQLRQDETLLRHVRYVEDFITPSFKSGSPTPGSSPLTWESSAP